jgi:osmoprotectant transport system substrate-binding protein
VRPRPGKTVRAAVLAVLLALTTAGCTATRPPAAAAPSATVRVASYDFAENQILAEIYAEAIRRAGLPVRVQHGVGTREVVEPALEQGLVDVVVDYLGTALAFVGQGGAPEPTSTETTSAVLAREFGSRSVTVLQQARAEDQNGFVVTSAFAARHGVARLSDLAPMAGGLTFGGPPECPQRPLCLQGLQQVYGLRFGHVRAMASRAATMEALLAGDIDVGLLETTDARLDVARVMLLVDDRGLQPHENVVPLVRTAALDRWGPPLRAAMDAVSARITTDDLRRLNAAVEIEGRTPAEAAGRFWSG